MESFGHMASIKQGQQTQAELKEQTKALKETIKIDKKRLDVEKQRAKNEKDDLERRREQEEEIKQLRVNLSETKSLFRQFKEGRSN